ncbi:hypothetical protein [Chitinophaga sp. 212800010-3]|uniref:hypothetical protein n=1 Tax=unclassified Chitinophaga TaxID=2619133 RepID=UPI002DF33A3A|nr:hypothetical protein [Chitinophaga sp. 212800010-3]
MPNLTIEDLSKEAIFIKKITTGDALSWEMFYVSNRDVYMRCVLWMGHSSATSYCIVQRFFVHLLSSGMYKAFTSTTYQELKKEVFLELKKYMRQPVPPRKKQLSTLIGK